MNIPDAIRDLQARVKGEFCIKGEDDCHDMKLGIEALRREIQHRQMAKSEYIWLLPGETKD